MNIKYEWSYANYINSSLSYIELIEECSKLYSSQYGKWSKKSSIRPGENIKLSPEKLHEWLENENASIYWAKDNETLVGYAIALQIDVPKYGIVSWVTQLVVHEKYRKREIAKNLLRSIWGFSNHYAWGIISANPYAIRALEKATRRRSEPIRIKHNKQKLISIGLENVPYITEKTKLFITEEASRINTEFFVDHTNVDKMINDVITDTVPWKLGDLEEGWEWIAFTFQDQLPFDLSAEEVETMLATSDQFVKNAYSRMDLSNQEWMANTNAEVDFIIKELGLKNNDLIIDFGCGQGRHALELAKKGMQVFGIDYIESNINHAKKESKKSGITSVEFRVGDCRYDHFDIKAKAAICLYDVIGTYSDNDENIKILKNIYDNLDTGGTALISVMNYELTLFQAKNKFVLKDSAKELMSLCPGNIQESTGNVFNPDYYLVDTESRIVYRREQFKRGKALPIELIVRDKRFTKREIIDMCESVGFEVQMTRFVNARDWITGFAATDKSAKEILIKCKKH